MAAVAELLTPLDSAFLERELGSVNVTAYPVVRDVILRDGSKLCLVVWERIDARDTGGSPFQAAAGSANRAQRTWIGRRGWR